MPPRRGARMLAETDSESAAEDSGVPPASASGGRDRRRLLLDRGGDPRREAAASSSSGVAAPAEEAGERLAGKRSSARKRLAAEREAEDQTAGSGLVDKLKVDYGKGKRSAADLQDTCLSASRESTSAATKKHGEGGGVGEVSTECSARRRTFDWTPTRFP